MRREKWCPLYRILAQTGILCIIGGETDLGMQANMGLDVDKREDK